MYSNPKSNKLWGVILYGNFLGFKYQNWFDDLKIFIKNEQYTFKTPKSAFFWEIFFETFFLFQKKQGKIKF